MLTKDCLLKAACFYLLLRAERVQYITAQYDGPHWVEVSVCGLNYSVWHVLKAIYRCNYKLERLLPPC